MVYKGCQAYLVHIIYKSPIEPWLESIPIICKFSNVFLKELPRLPLHQEFDFAIDLALDNVSILISSYRIVLAKLKV